MAICMESKLPGRSIADWAGDAGLYHRLRDSVLELTRGAGTFGDRANYVIERLRPIRPADFPNEMQALFLQFQALDQEAVLHFPAGTLLRSSRLSPRKRRAFADVIFNLYEEMLKARVRGGMED